MNQNYSTQKPTTNNNQKPNTNNETKTKSEIQHGNKNK